MSRDRIRALALFDDYLALDKAERSAALRALETSAPAVHRHLVAMLRMDASRHPLDQLPTQILDRLEQTDTPDHDARVGTRIGPWRITHRIGVGGMGAVYEAQRDDGQYQQRVALKCIRHGLTSPSLVPAFLSERNTLAQLNHAGIAPLLDGGLDAEDRPWFAMRLVDGEPIDAWCDRRNKSIAERVALLAQACDALAYAHGRMVLHQDIKPSNLLVTEDSQVQIVDFGVSVTLAGAAQLPRIAASPGYMAPEALSDALPSAALDIYSLGIVMFRLLCGRLPPVNTPLGLLGGGAPTANAGQDTDHAAHAAGRSMSALARQAAADEAHVRALPDTRALARVLDGDLDAIALRCTSANPVERYASMAELGDDLRRWLARRPVHARAGGIGYRLRMFFRRNPAVTVLAAVTLVTALAAAFVMHDQAQRAARETAAHDALASVFGKTLGLATLSGLGQNLVSSKAILRKTEAQMRQLALDDQPRVFARGLLALARNYATIGDYGQAKALADEAARLSEPDPVISIEVQATQAALYNIAGQSQEALETAQAALAGLRDQDGARLLPARLQLMTETARAQWDLVRHAEAERTLAQALALAKDSQATSPEAYIELLTLRGYWLVKQFQFERGDASLRQAIALAEPAYPLLAVDAERLLFNSLADQGRAAEARQFAELQWRNTRRVLGDAHPGTGSAWLVLGNARCNDGDLAGCRKAVEQGAQMISAGYGEDHPEYGLALTYRAWLMRIEGGQRDEMIALTRQALAILRRHYPVSHEKVANVQSLVAGRLMNSLETLSPQERAAAIREAKALLEEVLKACDQAGTPAPLLGRRSLANLLILSGREEDLQRAEDLLTENLDFIKQHRLEATPYQGINQTGLALLYLKRNRLDAADTLFAELQASALARLPDPNAYSRLNTATMKRAEIASRKGQPDRALALLREGLGRYKTQYPDDHRYVVGTRNAIQELEATGMLSPRP